MVPRGRRVERRSVYDILRHAPELLRVEFDELINARGATDPTLEAEGSVDGRLAKDRSAAGTADLLGAVVDQGHVFVHSSGRTVVWASRRCDSMPSSRWKVKAWGCQPRRRGCGSRRR